MDVAPTFVPPRTGVEEALHSSAGRIREPATVSQLLTGLAEPGDVYRCFSTGKAAMAPTQFVFVGASAAMEVVLRWSVDNSMTYRRLADLRVSMAGFGRLIGPGPLRQLRLWPGGWLQLWQKLEWLQMQMLPMLPRMVLQTTQQRLLVVISELEIGTGAPDGNHHWTSVQQGEPNVGVRW